MSANAARRASLLAGADIMHPDADKAQIVDFRPGTVGIAAGAGDMPDDACMFKKGIAMGNASEQVQHRADAVSDPNNDDGFARAVERFIPHFDAPRAVAEAG